MLGLTLQWNTIPSRGGVEILLLASCYRNWDTPWPNGPLGSYTEFTLIPLPCFVASSYSSSNRRPQRSRKNSSWPSPCQADGRVSHFIQGSSARTHHRQDQEEDWTRLWGRRWGIWWTGRHSSWWTGGSWFVIKTCTFKFFSRKVQF